MLVECKWLGKDLMQVEEDEVVAVHVMQTCRGSIDVAPLIHNVDTRWM